ncbi:hypothetical protein L1987_17722 [Smallanthus sonchifolius]|uniref:Uncharacterized protein n=1 Tax=Smallanthus sonchifolius TaxID=185202 RepID=A0ACB9IXL2_9ASTR|nr:hypothetical protein L1987_17722 [Smallanthus sonchifolius]
MKTLIFFSLAFILCVFKTNSAPGPVIDIYGKDLRAGVEYYAVPTSIDGFSGSILPAAVGNKSCPAGVVEYQTEGWSRYHEQYAVMVGGVEGNPGPETLDNWFKIEKTEDGYKFVFCPSAATVRLCAGILEQL